MSDKKQKKIFGVTDFFLSFFILKRQPNTFQSKVF